MSALTKALRKKYATPQAALRALGLDASLIEPRLARDEAIQAFRPLVSALIGTFRDKSRSADDTARRWPELTRIQIM